MFLESSHLWALSPKVLCFNLFTQINLLRVSLVVQNLWFFNQSNLSCLNEYQEFQNVFEKKNVGLLPKYCLYKCAVDLQEDVQRAFQSIYNLSQKEFISLKQYIEENLAKYFIQHLKSFVGMPILFRKRKINHSWCVLTIKA